MSNYKKKRLGGIFLPIGLALIIIFIYIMINREKLKIVEMPLIYLALAIGVIFTVGSIILLCLIPSKNTIKEKGIKGCCEILKIESAHSPSGRGHYTSFYFLVEFKDENGNIARDAIKCSLDDMNKYKNGTKLFCYIMGRNIYVPRPFQVIDDNNELLEGNK